MKYALMIVVAALGLGGCVTRPGVAGEVKVQTLYVKVRAACPEKPVYEALKKTRPRPLASTVMPSTAQERSDKQFAQLGKFEAPGGWADRVEQVLDRCQQEDGLTEPIKSG